MSDTTQSSGYYSDDAATFGDRVAAAREAIGLGQSDLARRLGIKEKTLRGWEEDIAEPRANKLQMVSGILNVSMRWLLTGEGDGLADPDGSAAVPQDINLLLIEMRQMRAQAAALSEQIGRLEKRLRAAMAAS